MYSDSYRSDDGDMDSEDRTDNESGLWTVESLTIFLSDVLSVMSFAGSFASRQNP